MSSGLLREFTALTRDDRRLIFPLDIHPRPEDKVEQKRPGCQGEIFSGEGPMQLLPSGTAIPRGAPLSGKIFP